MRTAVAVVTVLACAPVTAFVAPPRPGALHMNAHQSTAAVVAFAAAALATPGHWSTAVAEQPTAIAHEVRANALTATSPLFLADASTVTPLRRAIELSSRSTPQYVGGASTTIATTVAASGDSASNNGGVFGFSKLFGDPTEDAIKKAAEADEAYAAAEVAAEAAEGVSLKDELQAAMVSLAN